MKRILLTLSLLIGLTTPVFVPQTASAVEVFPDCNSVARRDTAVCKGQGDNILGSNGVLNNVINLLLVIGGIVAVIMIIIGGIRLSTSYGDTGQVKTARETIVYAVVGLVVAIMAFAIVNFVIGRL